MFMSGQRRWQVNRKKKPDEGQAAWRRLAFLRVLVISLFVVLAGQLWRLQIVEGSNDVHRALIGEMELGLRSNGEKSSADR